MRRLIQSATACLLVLASLTMIGGGAQPETALAGDATITACAEGAFDTALADVQNSGGGTLTIDCSDPITFTSQKVITSDVTIIGDGAILDGGDSTRLFQLSSGARLALIGLTLRNGNAGSEDGGAIHNDGGTLEVTASTLSGNTADDGGGIYSISGALSVTNSTLSGNMADDDGGGIYSFGVYTLINSTLTGNVADGDGGGILNFGLLSVINSTLSGNVAGDGGGGIYDNGGSVRLTNSTLSGNTADEGGGIFNAGGVALQNTIIANSGAPSGPGNCFDRPFVSRGGNLSDDESCMLGGPGDLDNTDDGLGPLADNGGPTQTHLPQDGSLAINNALNTACPAEDQRGISRPQGDDCDIGAVEVLAPLIDSIELDPAPSVEGQATGLVAGFSNPDASAGHTCEIDWGDGTIEPGTVDEQDGSGACEGSHSYLDDDTFAVTVEVCNGELCGELTTGHTVDNLPPSIDQIHISDAEAGDPVTVTVDASDPGVNDILSYAFDCNNDGSYEVGPQSGNSTTCPGDQTHLTMTIGIQVSDDDGGVTTDSVTLSFTTSYCTNPYSGQLRLRPDGCAGHEQELVLTVDAAVTLCANPGIGQLRYGPTGCPPQWQSYLVPGSEPLHTCQNNYTGGLRVTTTGDCGPHERLHLIPAI